MVIEMNNMIFPPQPYNINPYYYCNLQTKIQELENRINHLEERITLLEKNKEQNYLKKDDNYYMI